MKGDIMWRYFVSGIAVILFCVFCLYTCPVKAETYSTPRVIAQTEKATLWKFKYEEGGVTWVCHWLQNNKLVSGKLHSGLSCVIAEPCPNPDAHLPPSPLF